MTTTTTLDDGEMKSLTRKYFRSWNPCGEGAGTVRLNIYLPDTTWLLSVAVACQTDAKSFDFDFEARMSAYNSKSNLVVQMRWMSS